MTAHAYTPPATAGHRIRREISASDCLAAILLAAFIWGLLQW